MCYPAAKRLFDIICAGMGLVVLSPVGLVIALVIKLTDRGAVFYRQTRIGQFGKPFRIWKFRSMVMNADKMGGSITREDDPRITWIGRFLRKTKLDELPQLWNVLVGEMSFVGPRPEVPRYVELYTPEQREILKYKPGITDLASVLFRNEEGLLSGAADVEGFYRQYCLPRKIELNREYAARAGLLQDLWIIVQTLCPYWLGVSVVYCGPLAASFWLAYQLRSDFRMSGKDYEEFWRYLPWIVFPQLLLLFWRGQLRGLISYFSIPEMRQTVTALGAALMLQVGLCYFSQGRLVPTKSILVMDFVLSCFALCGLRMVIHLLREQSSRPKMSSHTQPHRVAIIGTGELATNLALDFARSQKPARRVVAFFDDDPRTWHKRPHDIPVLGMPECLLNPEWPKRIDEVIIAVPEENSARFKEIVEMLKGLPLKVTFASGWPMLRGEQGLVTKDQRPRTTDRGL